MNRARVAIMAVLMITFPARSSELGILIDKQFGQKITTPLLFGSSFTEVSPNGYGIRGAYTILNLKVTELGISATYHPKAEADFEVDHGFIKITQAKGTSNKYFALGAHADWKLPVNLHVGIDLRREEISSIPHVHMSYISSPGLPTTILLHAEPGSTTITRPWVAAGIGYSFTSPVVSPFIRLEAAYTLRTYSLPVVNATGDDLRKAIAPKFQFALYGGVSF